MPLFEALFSIVITDKAKNKPPVENILRYGKTFTTYKWL